jgi:hypothetical protein
MTIDRMDKPEPRAWDAPSKAQGGLLSFRRVGPTHAIRHQHHPLFIGGNAWSFSSPMSMMPELFRPDLRRRLRKNVALTPPTVPVVAGNVVLVVGGLVVVVVLVVVGAAVVVDVVVVVVVDVVVVGAAVVDVVVVGAAVVVVLVVVGAAVVVVLVVVGCPVVVVTGAAVVAVVVAGRMVVGVTVVVVVMLTGDAAACAGTTTDRTIGRVQDSGKVASVAPAPSAFSSGRRAGSFSNSTLTPEIAKAQ